MQGYWMSSEITPAWKSDADNVHKEATFFTQWFWWKRWRAVTAGLSSSASPFLSIFCISVSTKTNDLWPDLVRAIPKSTEVIWDSKRNFFSFFACTAWLPSHPSPSVLSVSSHIARLFSLQLWLMRSSWRPLDHVLSVRLCTPVHHICSRWTKKWILITAHPATRHPVLLSLSLKPKNTKLKDFINQRFQHRIKRETSGYSTFVTVSIRLPATKKKTQQFWPTCALCPRYWPLKGGWWSDSFTAAAAWFCFRCFGNLLLPFYFLNSCDFWLLDFCRLIMWC